jgi:hypothetical protein
MNGIDVDYLVNNFNGFGTAPVKGNCEMFELNLPAPTILPETVQKDKER